MFMVLLISIIVLKLPFAQRRTPLNTFSQTSWLVGPLGSNPCWKLLPVLRKGCHRSWRAACSPENATRRKEFLRFGVGAENPNCYMTRQDSPGACDAPEPDRTGREGWAPRPPGSASTEQPAGSRAGSCPDWSAPLPPRGPPAAERHGAGFMKTRAQHTFLFVNLEFRRSFTLYKRKWTFRTKVSKDVKRQKQQQMSGRLPCFHPFPVTHL